ncbi:hypothetical protein [Rhizobium leguminosarum]|uniref:hypothetical protein n=1 Tax=Rhizobium leguminosarum TaxID=384 RepID=UPI001C98D286|nr:hypothetical protein [Rhizobium leguminosarum]MBY5581860.1 hypothetical protein [Rhizobium leguminosarum]
MANGRVEVNPSLGLNNQLRPQATAVDTFATPAQAPIDKSLERLSQALAGFSTSIDSYGQVAAIKDKAATDEAFKLEKARQSGLSWEQLQEERKAGTLPAYKDPIRQAGIEAIQGMVRGRSLSDAMQNHLKTDYDPEKDGSVRDYVQRMQKEAIVGMTDAQATQVLAQSNSVSEWGEGFLNDKKNTETIDAAKASAYQYMDTQVVDGIKNSISPEDIAKRIWDNYAAKSTKGFLGVDYKDLDNSTLAIARNYADKSPSVAIALLTTPKKGTDGITGSLLDNPRLREQADNIIATANRTLDLQEKKTLEDGVAQAALEALTNKSLNSVRDVALKTTRGTEVNVSADQVKKQGVQLYLDKVSPQLQKDFHEGDEDRLQREFVTLNNAGQQHPFIKGEVNGINALATPATMSDPEARDKLLQRTNRAVWLMNVGKNSGIDYMDDEKDRKFAMAYSTFKRVTQKDGSTMSDDEALTAAMETTNPSVGGVGGLSRDAQDRIDQKVRDDIATKPGWLWGRRGAAPKNFSVPQQMVTDLATKYIVGGNMDEDAAIDAAVESVAKSVFTYNGVVLTKPKGFQLNEDFEEVVGSHITDWVKANPKTMRDNGLSGEDDLAIKEVNDPYGNNSGGRFRLVHADDLTPVMDDSGHMVVLTVQQLREEKAAIKDKKNRKAIKDTQ